jgi:hypothetical protein
MFLFLDPERCAELRSGKLQEYSFIYVQYEQKC